MTVELEVPARAEYVGLVRMLVSSLAASRRQIDEEFIDNLKLAVSEACTLVVDAPGSDRLMLTWDDDEESLVVDVQGAAPADEDAVLPFQIMRALVDKVERISAATLRLQMMCSPQP